MPTPRRRTPSTPQPSVGAAALPNITFSTAEVNALVSDATKSVAKKMGVRERDLPSSVKNAIKTATQNALNARSKAVIQRDVDSVVKDKVLGGVKPLDLLDARMQAAKQGIAHISADAKVDAVLKDTAKLLWKKYNALISAGFTEDQAFSLLLGEVQGRASRNK